MIRNICHNHNTKILIIIIDTGVLQNSFSYGFGRNSLYMIRIIYHNHWKIDNILDIGGSCPSTVLGIYFFRNPPKLGPFPLGSALSGDFGHTASAHLGLGFRVQRFRGVGFTHRLQSSSFLGLPSHILNINHKKELQWSLEVAAEGV